MKNILLSYAISIALSPFSLQAMMWSSPEEMHVFFASLPLRSIERQLVKKEIESKGALTILNTVNSPECQTLIMPLTLKSEFDRQSNDQLTKDIFRAIDAIESKPKSNSCIPQNYLGLATQYYLYPNNKVHVVAKLSNLEEIRHICAEHTQ